MKKLVVIHEQTIMCLNIDHCRFVYTQLFIFLVYISDKHAIKRMGLKRFFNVQVDVGLASMQID